MPDRDANVVLIKTALLERWEIARMGKDGLISKHLREYPIKELSEIFVDFAESKLKEFPENGCTFTVKERRMRIIIEPIKEEEI